MTFQRRGSMKIMKSVLFALLLRELRGRFEVRRFGAFWMFFEPAAQIGIIVAIFSARTTTVFGNLEFPVFLITGMVPYFLLRNIALQGMEAVNANKALFAYKQIMPFDTVLARTIIEIVLYAVVYVVFLVILGFWFDYDVSVADPLKWLSVLLIGLLFSFSLGLMFCMLIEILPESRTFIRMLFFPIYLLSGIIFPIWVFPKEIMDWLLWNPYLHIIDELRQASFTHYPEHYGVNLLFPLKAAVFLLLFTMGLYRLRRHNLVSL